MASLTKTENVASFMAITGMDSNTASFYLESAGNNMDLAVQLFFSQNGSLPLSSTPTKPAEPSYNVENTYENIYATNSLTSIYFYGMRCNWAGYQAETLAEKKYYTLRALEYHNKVFANRLPNNTNDGIKALMTYDLAMCELMQGEEEKALITVRETSTMLPSVSVDTLRRAYEAIILAAQGKV